MVVFKTCSCNYHYGKNNDHCSNYYYCHYDHHYNHHTDDNYDYDNFCG